MISRGQVDHETSKLSQLEEKKSKKRKIDDEIIFFEVDLKEIKYPHDDPVVVSLNIFNYDVYQVLVDNESSVDVLFYDVFVCMNLNFEVWVKRNTPLIGFLDSMVPVEGTISLTMIVGQAPRQAVVEIKYSQ